MEDHEDDGAYSNRTTAEPGAQAVHSGGTYSMIL